MKIQLKQGKKFQGDKIVYITAKDEMITITKLIELINVLAINETKRLKAKYPTRYKELLKKFLLEKAITDYGINLGKNEISFREWLSEEKNLKEFVKLTYLGHRKANIYEEIVAGIEYE